MTTRGQILEALDELRTLMTLEEGSPQAFRVRAYDNAIQGLESSTADVAAMTEAELVKVKGIGPWTANIYLMTILHRPDIWPTEDLALAVATQQLKRLQTRPTPQELDNLSIDWKPWRAVAARLLWHYYLNGPKNTKESTK